MAELFPTTTGFARGYDQDQVTAFFADARRAYEGDVPAEQFSSAQIRAAAFDLVRGGYDVPSVDAALNRLEAAFIQRDRSTYMASRGESAWYTKVADDATVLYPRLLRPEGERFDHPDGLGQGYSTREVDAVLDLLAGHFDDKNDLVESDLRTVTFSTKRGQKAYNEAQVDSYLGRAVQILMAVS